MRVLLDEWVPSGLRGDLPEHQVRTVFPMGWRGIKNGKLLRLTADQFDCRLTVDRNLQFQQNIGAVDIAVIVVHASSNDVASLRRVLPEIRQALSGIQPGQILPVGL